MLKIFAAVVLAISMSAGAASAMTAKDKKHPMMAHSHKHGMMAHHHKHAMMAHRRRHMLPACGEGMVKAACVCHAMSSKMHQMCKAGQWCHTYAGACGQ
jgi:hypothetical protein